MVVIEGDKLLLMYRVGELSSHIGEYTLYGDIEHLTFSSDSVYLVVSISDTRLFFLMMCDVKEAGHQDRALVSYSPSPD